MNLIRHAKMTIGPGLTKLAFVSMLGGIGSIVNAAIVAPTLQDHDHKKAHKVELKHLHVDQDENVEIIVIGEADSGHQDLLKKLKKEHNIEIKLVPRNHDNNVVIRGGDSDHKGLHKKLKMEHKIDVKALHGGIVDDLKVVVIGDEEHPGNIEKEIHSHVVELLHGQGAADVDYHKMAEQLREIADRLDGRGHSGNKKHGHHEDIEIRHREFHGPHVLRNVRSTKVKNDDVKVVKGVGKHFQIHRAGEPHEMIIEVTSEDNPKVHAFSGDHTKVFIYRTNDQDSAGNEFVEEIHVDRKQRKHADKSHVGKATTSDETDHRFKDLKAELDALQNELRQLRSKRARTREKRERRKTDQSSTDDKAKKRLLWVVEDADEKTGNTFVWKTADDSDKETSPHQFRFEFKKKDSNSTGSSSDKK